MVVSAGRASQALGSRAFALRRTNWLQSVDFAGPTVEVGFLEPVVEVVDDLGEALAATGSYRRAGAADTGLLCRGRW